MGNGETKHIVVALDESGEPKKGLTKAMPNCPAQKLHV